MINHSAWPLFLFPLFCLGMTIVLYLTATPDNFPDGMGGIITFGIGTILTGIIAIAGLFDTEDD